MHKSQKKWIKRIAILIFGIGLIAVALIVGFQIRTRVAVPLPADTSANQLTVQNPSKDFYKIGNNWLKRNSSGLWEMYVEGTPYNRGVIKGKLSKHLIDYQEKAFIDRIRQMIPSDSYLKFLKYFIYWFNRDLSDYISDEYKEEIYGISQSASSEFSAIGSNYQRMLNYHSAHDIGHALQDFALVGCTSFGVWDSESADSSLIVGRNFDFYVGDAFAENKIICFEKPAKGYRFMMVTWGGMIGCVSGMNEKGLTVTLNAAKSDIPGSARTPISILAREILQYAGNIDEAFAIAKNRETFVSESLLIGSASDHQAAIIEKSPFKISLVKSAGDYIACANHFQSPEFAADPLNIKNQNENATTYRYKRLIQDISKADPLDYQQAATILRDQRGLNDENIGMGNEKAMNQLIAHHAIIFQPEKRLVWVSTTPWQLGAFVCYDLSKIFAIFAAQPQPVEMTEPDKTTSSDPFLESIDYQHFQRFREIRKSMVKAIKSGDNTVLQSSFLDEFVATNPEYWEVYSLTGDYHAAQARWNQAQHFYILSLSKEIPSWQETQFIIKKLAACNLRIKKLTK